MPDLARQCLLLRFLGLPKVDFEDVSEAKVRFHRAEGAHIVQGDPVSLLLQDTAGLQHVVIGCNVFHYLDHGTRRRQQFDDADSQHRARAIDQGNLVAAELVETPQNRAVEGSKAGMVGILKSGD